MFHEKGLFCTMCGYAVFGRHRTNPPRERPLRCAKPGSVHWRPRSGGGLRTGNRRNRTNPLPSDPSGAQSPGSRFGAPYETPSRATPPVRKAWPPDRPIACGGARSAGVTRRPSPGIRGPKRGDAHVLEKVPGRPSRGEPPTRQSAPPLSGSSALCVGPWEWPRRPDCLRHMGSPAISVHKSHAIVL